MAIVRNKNKQVSFVEKKSGRLRSAAEVLAFARDNGVRLHPIDVRALVKLFNVKLIEEDMDDVSGYIERRAGSWVIGVNQYDHPRRQRFTIAHELAHFLLHRQIIEDEGGRHNDVIMMRDGSINPIEQEANSFAAELLMPQPEIKNMVQQGISTIKDLAMNFGVSTAAMHYRLSKLGYLR